MNKLFSDGVGLDWYATPFRGYDPQVGRFWQIDELSEMYESFSVYNFAFNNPIYFNDPTGLDPATQVTPNNNDPKVEVLPEVVVLGSRRNSWNYDHWVLFADANKHHDPTDLHKYLSESGVDERGLRLFNTAWKNIGYRERRYEIEVRYRERVELILKTALDYTPPGRGAVILKVTYKVVKNAGREAAKTGIPNSGPIMKSLGAASRAEMLAKKLKMNINSPTTRQVLNSLDESVESFISTYRRSSIRSEIPGQFLNQTVEEALKSGNTTIRKLLTDGRFVK